MRHRAWAFARSLYILSVTERVVLFCLQPLCALSNLQLFNLLVKVNLTCAPVTMLFNFHHSKAVVLEDGQITLKVGRKLCCMQKLCKVDIEIQSV